MKISKYIIIIALAACAKVPVTGRKQVKLLPEFMLQEMSLTSYQQVIKDGPLSKNQKDIDRLKVVEAKIVAGVENYLRNNGFAKRLEGVKWEINLIDKNIQNAWCMPGGKIAFYSGILPLCQDEFGIATVMGHEIAHAIARHGNERMSQQLMIQTGQVALTTALSTKPKETQNLFLMAYGAGAQLGLLLPYSRTHETEADKMGLIFMAMAGYDPSKAIEFWKRMAAQSGNKPPELLSTHPSDENRIKTLQAFLPTALKYYKK